ncbi:SDR family oxidoreductase [Shewanella sp. NIFS-20-20]|uniref:SDR family NAD(P)-dependent oxidoreductase n=1 Tax=Shewanella sp. NIFS-20-20 TaxID=2853806 RepID=UPI001C462175|nr:SDR family NAD(P)-dependent oxidoreductase [Shewanella sp. NIFS-20-20]MBV7316802.1 SDR family NAD(P)-dependent oxidoreductase [Shewanella sp. NIFS-20-20]
MTQAKAIIVGASSQLSQEIVRQMCNQGVRLHLLLAEPESLTEFVQQLPAPVTLEKLDLQNPDAAIATLKLAWQQLGGADLILVNTGLNLYHPSLPWQAEQQMIAINVQGFSAIGNTAFNLFMEQGYGHLGVINSIAGQRGGSSVAYHASKAYAANYLQGLSMHAQRLKLPLTITDIQLGLLDKAAMHQSRLWSAPLPKVAGQIIKALNKGKRRAYVTKRWALMAWLSNVLPEYIYNTRRWKKKGEKK